jgi:osmotically-inducible protein OsmY
MVDIPQSIGITIMKTDSQLQQDVMDELAWEPSVHAAQIGVQVKEGVVSLTGEVGSYAEKWNAERAAQRVGGVNALAVELQVKLSALGERTDADIARSVKSILGWSVALPEDPIKVSVEKGWLTLSGEVEWQYQRQDAAKRVRNLSGVTGVSNQISIRTPISSSPSASIVKSSIEAALKRLSTSDGDEISVNVSGHDVTLTGAVHNWAERELAKRSAWGSPGVRRVVDNMNFLC